MHREINEESNSLRYPESRLIQLEHSLQSKISEQFVGAVSVRGAVTARIQVCMRRLGWALFISSWFRSPAADSSSLLISLNEPHHANWKNTILTWWHHVLNPLVCLPASLSRMTNYNESLGRCCAICAKVLSFPMELYFYDSPLFKIITTS